MEDMNVFGTNSEIVQIEELRKVFKKCLDSCEDLITKGELDENDTKSLITLINSQTEQELGLILKDIIRKIIKNNSQTSYDKVSKGTSECLIEMANSLADFHANSLADFHAMSPEEAEKVVRKNPIYRALDSLLMCRDEDKYKPCENLSKSERGVVDQIIESSECVNEEGISTEEIAEVDMTEDECRLQATELAKIYDDWHRELIINNLYESFYKDVSRDIIAQRYSIDEKIIDNVQQRILRFANSFRVLDNSYNNKEHQLIGVVYVVEKCIHERYESSMNRLKDVNLIRMLLANIDYDVVTSFLNKDGDKLESIAVHCYYNSDFMWDLEDVVDSITSSFCIFR